MITLQKEDIKEMSYVQFLAAIDEVNRPPGGKDSIRRIVQNTFLNRESRVLDVGCNTGYSTFEIAHLAKCHVTGVDISPEMIVTANRRNQTDVYKNLIEFKVADGMNLPFHGEIFDVTISGGSTAFIDDKVRALQEYTRVTKMWGFVVDINLFYKREIPTKVIESLNTAMGINIQPWTKDYWVNLYKKTDLEIYHTYFDDVYAPSDTEITEYCKEMANKVDATDDARSIIQERLTGLMTLFSENNSYLSYGIFILRKRDEKEQISLFGA